MAFSISGPEEVKNQGILKGKRGAGGAWGPAFQAADKSGAETLKQSRIDGHEHQWCVCWQQGRELVRVVPYQKVIDGRTDGPGEGHWSEHTRPLFLLLPNSHCGLVFNPG